MRPSTTRDQPAARRLAGGRYEVVGRLGEGGMGIVYEARDHEGGGTVAVKAMRRLGPEALRRFKREFRALRGIDHPNLVHLGELFEDDGLLYFTMERVDGVDLLTALSGEAAEGPATETVSMSTWTPAEDGGSVHPASIPPPAAPATPVDRERLAQLFVQLAQALRALHDAGRVHRDVKPSNVLVTPRGRVVLLDFGLVVTTPDDVDELVGTAPYMAPEQAAREPVGPATDWYAVGVMLYEALTGRLPFDGRPHDILDRKQSQDPVAPSTWLAVSSDLEALCMGLLARDPGSRLDGDAIVTTLEPARALPSRPLGSRVFVGRQELVAAALEALDETRAGRTVALVLEGPSGVGKSTAAEAILGAAKVGHADLLALRGRCYVHEAVPYRGIDEMVDELSRVVEREGLAPRTAAGAAAMGTLFPVMRGPWPDEAGPPQGEPGTLRGQAVSELRALLARLAATRPVVLLLDDLQWVGADGAALLDDLLAPPDPPPLLLVATRRPPTRQDVGAATTLPLSGDVRASVVEPLSSGETRILASRILGLAADHPLVAQVAGAAQGSPLLVELLARHHVGADDSTLADADDALLSRLDALEATAVTIAELVALAERPLTLDVLGAVLDEERNAVMDHIHTLRARGFCRLDVRRGSTVVAPSHDRVREIIEARLDRERSRELHRGLAQALTTLGGAHDALAYHWHGAEDVERAGEHAKLAAITAERELAFERAANRWRDYIAWTAPEGPPRRDALRRVGDALAQAGRGRDAADAYREAAAIASPDEALELKQIAAVQLIQSGRFDEGMTMAEPLLEAAGFLHRRGVAAAAAFARRGASLRLRNYRFVARRDASVDEVRRLDRLAILSTAFGVADIVGGASLQTRLVELALEVGDPGRVALSLAPLAVYWSALGPRGVAHAEAILARSRALSEGIDDAWLQGRLLFAAGFSAMHAGQWSRAASELDRAVAVLSAHVGDVGLAADIAAARAAQLWVYGFCGRLGDLRRLMPGYLRDARRRNDIFASTHLQIGMPACAWLVDDAPDRARQRVREATDAWTARSQSLGTVRLFADFARMQIDLYEGEPRRRERRADWSQLLMLGNQLIRAYMTDAQARTALALGELARARRLGRRLERAGAPWCAALAQLIDAGIRAAADGRAPHAYRRAASALDHVGMTAHAAAARHRAGEEAALQALRDERVKRPERWVAMLAPSPRQ